jgi:alpha-glucan,water dikinase
MAVLVQRLVEAEYAFVVHTVNPSTNDKNEMYAEIVVGLGEVLVGNFPGRALGFSMKKDMSEPPHVSVLFARPSVTIHTRMCIAFTT